MSARPFATYPPTEQLPEHDSMPSFLQKKPEAAKIQPMQTELQIQRAQFEQALAMLIGQIDQLPARLADVMLPGAGPAKTMPCEVAGTPLGAWLQLRTADMNHLSMQVRAILDRIDL